MHDRKVLSRRRRHLQVNPSPAQCPVPFALFLCPAGSLPEQPGTKSYPTARLDRWVTGCDNLHTLQQPLPHLARTRPPGWVAAESCGILPCGRPLCVGGLWEVCPPPASARPLGARAGHTAVCLSCGRPHFSSFPTSGFGNHTSHAARRPPSSTRPEASSYRVHSALQHLESVSRMVWRGGGKVGETGGVEECVENGKQTVNKQRLGAKA